MIGSPEWAKDVLTQHQYLLNTEIEERQLTLLDLRTFLQEDPMNYRVDQLPARQTLSIRTRLQPPHYEVIPEALRELMLHARARGYEVEAPSFSVHDNDDQGEGSRVDVYLPVQGRSKAADASKCGCSRAAEPLWGGLLVLTTKRVLRMPS